MPRLPLLHGRRAGFGEHYDKRDRQKPVLVPTRGPVETLFVILAFPPRRFVSSGAEAVHPE